MKNAKFHTLYFLLFFILSSTILAQLTDDLESYYNFDNGPDDVHENRETTVQGAVFNPFGGKINGAYEFNDSGSFLNSSYDSSDSISIAGWFYFKELGQLHGETLIHKDKFFQTIDQSKRDFWWTTDETPSISNKTKLYLWNSNGEEDNVIANTPIPKPNQWVHLAFSYDSITNMMRLYQNGQLVGEKIHAGGGPLRNTHKDLFIGRTQDDTSLQRYFNGSIDEIGIWNRVLSDSEIEELYNNGNGLPYPFSEEPVCGNSIIEENEECDDGNTNDGDGCSNSCIFEEPDINPLLTKFAPVLKLHPDEIYTPKEILSLMNYSDLKKNSDLVKSAPINVSDITNLESSYEYFMDMNNVNINNIFDLPDPGDFENFDIKVYGRIVEDENFKHLQYYIFYPFQKWYTMDHEGDWEFVQVTLNKIDEIHSVSYVFNKFTEVYYDLDLIELINETHPVVLVAKGSHNNYGKLDAYYFPNNLFPEQEIIQFWDNLFFRLKGVEKIDGTGLVVGPSILSSSNDLDYEIEEINDGNPLVEYGGRWGQETIIPLRSGPKGPKYNPRFYRQWLIPNAFTTFPNFPFMGAFVFSPVDIEVLDSNGNTINETSEFLSLYTGKDEEHEAIMVDGLRNFTLNLIATGEGNFSLEVYFYDNETDKGIMLRYSNITVYQTTKGNLGVSLGSYFVLYLNDDEDSDFERFFLPDEVITYNNFTYVLPDKDNDSVNDFKDNCKDIPNQEQEDFNGDGKGDACDNPKYYKEKSLELIEGIEYASKKQYLKYVLAKISIKNSLYSKFWDDDFHVDSILVFINELLAINHLHDEDEISQMLAKADSLIVEKLILEENNNHSHKFKLGKEFFERGNEMYKNEKYGKAIVYYMKAWALLE